MEETVEKFPGLLGKGVTAILTLTFETYHHAFARIPQYTYIIYCVFTVYHILYNEDFIRQQLFRCDNIKGAIYEFYADVKNL